MNPNAALTRNLKQKSNVRRIVQNKWKMRMHRVFYKTGARGINARLFDAALLSLIVLGAMVVMFQSMRDVREEYGLYLLSTEILLTIIFALEFVSRFATAYEQRRFLFSVYNILDLLAIVAAYPFWMITGSNYFLLLRIGRTLHIFKVLDLNQYTLGARELTDALKESGAKIVVFTVSVLAVVVVVGFMMFLVESDTNPGFSSIPRSIYWAIVTLTTVGYGDISPQTSIGRFLAAIVMILGYGVIAVPTGIVSSEISASMSHHEQERRREEEERNRPRPRNCTNCGAEIPSAEARFCHACGTLIATPAQEQAAPPSTNPVSR